MKKDTNKTTTMQDKNYVSREEYDKAVQENRQLRQDILHAFMQKHMYDLAMSDRYTETQKALHSIMLQADSPELMAALAEILNFQFSLIATYFYKAALRDEWDYGSSEITPMDLTHVSTTPLKHTAEKEDILILDDGVGVYIDQTTGELRSSLVDNIAETEDEPAAILPTTSVLPN